LIRKALATYVSVGVAGMLSIAALLISVSGYRVQHGDWRIDARTFDIPAARRPVVVRSQK
jgi:hypothetical protein